MERFGRGASLAVLLATLTVTCPVAHAESDVPPAGGARLGLAIAQLDETWRKSNAYRSSGVMVVGVDSSGRAAKSGILPGDVLVSVGGRTMREPSDLGYAERSLSRSQAVSVVLARDGGHSIKIFEIAPVGAAPAVEPAVAPASGTVDLSAAADSPAAVAATDSVLDTASPQAAILAAAAAADSALQPAGVAKTSAGADTVTPAPASGTLVVEPKQAAGQKSADSLAAPSPTAAGSAGTQSAAGAAAAAPMALAAPAAIAAVPVLSSVVEPGATPAPATAAVDSGGTSPGSVEPAPVELGVVGRSLTPDLATALGASGVEGILVLEVTAASPADRSGLRAGDIILTVGGKPVSDMEELQRAAAASSAPIPISTLRLGKTKVELVTLDGPPLTPFAPPSQEQLLMDLRDEVRSLRREVESLRKKLGK